MKKKISRYLIVTALCFSCILLFKSGNMEANGAGPAGERAREAGYDRSRTEEEECGCRRGSLRLYLDGRSYITLDVVLLVVVMVFAFLLVLGKVCG